MVARDKWIGPFQVRRLLEGCFDAAVPKPPDSGSAYVVTLKRWRAGPSAKSEPLYVGGNVGRSKRFRTRVGDLLADAFGFYGSETGHHSGGKSLHKWCKKNGVNPLELYIGWVASTKCHRCLEVRLFSELQPRLNRKTPPQCVKHS